MLMESSYKCSYYSHNSYFIIGLLLLLSMPPVYSSLPTTCATCEELANSPPSGLFVTTYTSDPVNKFLKITAYYDDISASPTRQPLKNSIVLVDLSNSSGFHKLFKTYTDGSGQANFSFNQWSGSCINFKVLYCPYCLPPEKECTGFQQCLDLANIDKDSIGNIKKAADIPDAPDAKLPVQLLEKRFLPQSASASYCPPPPPLSTTPAMCFPLVLIFALLSGALYLTGRNPFAGFNIGGQHIGQHIKYQARGRGYSFSGTSAIMAGVSIAEAATVMSKGQKDSTGKTVTGFKALAARESSMAKERGFLGMVKLEGGKLVGTLSVRRIKEGLTSIGAASKAAEASRSRSGGPGGLGSVSGSELARGAQQTGFGVQSGSSMASPLSIMNIRPSELFSTKHGLVGTVARLAVFMAANTILGRSIDMVYSLSKGESIFESLFVDRNQRIFEALKAVADLKSADGKGLNVTAGGKMLTLIAEKPNKDGSTTYVIASPEGAGKDRLQTVDGTISVIINDKTGKIESISYLSFGVLRSRSDPDGTAVVTIKPGSRDGTMDIYAASVKDGAKFGDEPKATDKIVVGLGRTGTVEKQMAATGAYEVVKDYLAVGSNGKEFAASCQSVQHVIRQNYESIQREGSVMLAKMNEQIIEKVNESPAEVRSLVRSVRQDVAAEAWKDALGMKSGYNLIASIVPGGKDYTMFESRDAKSIEVRPLETALQRVTQAADASNILQIGEIVGNSKINTVHKEYLFVALNNSTIDDILSFVRTNQKTGKSDYSGFVSKLESLDFEKSAINALVANKDLLQNISQSAQTFKDTLKSQGCSDQLIAKTISFDLEKLGKLMPSGRFMPEDATADLLAFKPERILNIEGSTYLTNLVREASALNQLINDSGKGVLGYQGLLDERTAAARERSDFDLRSTKRKDVELNNPVLAQDGSIQQKAQVYGDTMIVNSIPQLQRDTKARLMTRDEYASAIDSLNAAITSGDPSKGLGGLEIIRHQINERVGPDGARRYDEMIMLKGKEKGTGDFQSKKRGDVT